MIFFFFLLFFEKLNALLDEYLKDYVYIEIGLF